MSTSSLPWKSRLRARATGSAATQRRQVRTNPGMRACALLLLFLAVCAGLPPGECRAEAATAIETLVGQLDDPEPQVRLRAVQQLRDAGPRALPALPLLLAMPAADANQKPAFLFAFRFYLAQCLARIGPPALPGLLQALQGDDLNTRIVAVRALGEMGPPAAAAVPALLELTQADDFNLRYWSFDALGRIGPAAAAAVPDLIQQFEAGNVSTRELAAHALAGIATSEALAATRSYRLSQAIQGALYLPFIAFMLVPGLALVVPALLLLPLLSLRRRQAPVWLQGVVLLALLAWLAYAVYETALALFWRSGGEPIRVDLLLLVPLLYLLLLLALLAWLWGRFGARKGA